LLPNTNKQEAGLSPQEKEELAEVQKAIEGMTKREALLRSEIDARIQHIRDQIDEKEVKCRTPIQHLPSHALSPAPSISTTLTAQRPVAHSHGLPFKYLFNSLFGLNPLNPKPFQYLFNRLFGLNQKF
jgi:hypothetical protein